MVIKVAIIGASGVFGKVLISQFQKAGRAVRAISRNPNKIRDFLGEGSEALAFDLLNHPGSL